MTVGNIRDQKVAEVGCTTFLIEKKPELGGLASVISKIPDNLEGKKLRTALSFKAFRSFMYIPM